MIYYIAISLGIFIFCSIIIVLQPSGQQRDSVQRRLSVINNAYQKSYLHDDELNLPFFERIMKLIIKPYIVRIRKSMKKNPSQGFFFRSIKNEKLKKNVYQAGLSMEVHEYQIMRIFVFLGAAFITFFIALLLKQSFLYCLIAALIGIYIAYAVLRFHLTARITKRHTAMEKQLPEVLEFW